MPREKGNVDGESARIKKQDGPGVDALYNFDPSLPHGHDHIKSRDGVSAIYVRDGGKVVWDERQFIIEAKERVISQAEQISATDGFHAGHQRAQQLRTEFKEAGFAGKETEPKLRARFEAALKRFYDQSKAERDQRSKQREEAARRKQTLVGRAQRLAESTDWKSASAEYRELLAQWKQIGPAGREQDDRLWRDFNGARSRFRQRQEARFNQLAKERESNRQRKQRLVNEANSVATNTDLRAAFPAMRMLMEQWKTIGPAGREHDQELWSAFAQAQDRLRARAKTARSHAELIKRELVAEASSIAAYADLREAGLKWRSIMERWKASGRASRVVEDEYRSRLQGYRRQLDARYDASKAERAQRAREGLQRLEAAAARKRMAISDLDNRISEVYSRPAVRPGPRQWEIQANRDNKIARLQSFKASHQYALSEIERKLRDAYSRQR